MPRKMLDCREMPSESGCTLTLTGEADEVLEAGAAHAVAVHGHTDGEELRAGLRAGLRDAPQATGPGAFVQLIEFQTQQYDQMDALIDGWKAEIGADRTAEWMVMGRDRDRDGHLHRGRRVPQRGGRPAQLRQPGDHGLRRQDDGPLRRSGDLPQPRGRARGDRPDQGWRRRGRGWQVGHQYDDRFMNGARATGVPQRGHGRSACP